VTIGIVAVWSVIVGLGAMCVMHMDVHVEHFSEFKLLFGGEHEREGGLVVLHVLCVSKNRLENTDDAWDM
jgi:hypothetical protein